ncbi:thiopeptide-type bacteriocin biosynthesis protein [Streptomyces sp. RFCAC02]|uniref:thiopeptide-type bacteriocin biosynthesis protein n=1 Tax=Streptomyces sp. RFCAC02 TaxID=2499143 RepID=UPI001F103AAB|nr:thiopeptide-type bacteriocin biosynthesis protein [Streptomyces sp. RFCAC02]
MRRRRARRVLRRPPLPADGAGYAAARRAFLAAGLAALREHLPDAGWVQLNLTPDASGPAGLHRRLAAAAGETLGSGLARDFFFMHKPPGVRARFRAAEPSLAGDLRTVLLRHLTPDQGAAAGQRPVATVYEPETYLFGGPRSMPHVHTLFTADSLAWLDLHTGAAGGQPPAAWRVSLTLLRTVFDRLGIDGWEHRGVWQAVRDETGRRLPGGLHDTALRRVADGIRAHWAEGAEAQLAALPEAWRNVLGPRLDGVARAAEQWRTRYFASGEATVGPRRAAAHHVIFHWNRGLVSTARQCLLTEALAADGHEGTE